MILNSPANPTGGIVPPQLTAEIAEVLAGHDCYILSDEVYSEMLYGARHDTVAAHHGPARPHAARRRVLEDLRHDRLAARLRRPAGRAGRADHAPFDQLGVVHGSGRAARRRGGAAGAARRGGRHAGRVRPPPKRRGRRPERPAGRLLRDAPGGVLRLPQHHRDGHGRARRRRSPAERGRSGRARRHGLRGSTARATCACPTPTRSRTSPRRSPRWATCSAPSPSDAGHVCPHRRHPPHPRSRARAA